MSFQTMDNFIFDGMQSSVPRTKPFLEKKYLYVADNNPSSNYSTSQIQFTTEVFSNNGKYNNFQEGYILLPFVIKVDGPKVCGDDKDLFLGIKNSNLVFVHKVNVEYNNAQVVMGCEYLNQYIIFKQHSELSTEDEFLNGKFLGYAKDTSTTWSYTDAPTSEGQGICNNFISTTFGYDPLENTGFKKRVNTFVKHTKGGKDKILSGSNDGNQNYIQDAVLTAGANTKVYYYNAYIRLRDLSSFFENVPMVRGGTVKITMTLNNNVNFELVKSSTGTLTMQNFVNNTGTTNPLMISASYKAVPYVAPATVVGDVKNTVSAPLYIPSGSAPIGLSGETPAAAATIKVSMALSSNGGYSHYIKQCRLYVPAYVLDPSADAAYISQKIRTVEYVDMIHYDFIVPAKQSINQLITNGLDKMRRLVVVGLISSGNGKNGNDLLTAPVENSCFTTEPSTCSPFKINNFNVYVGGVPLYENASMTYDYEKFLLEMNGQYGINGNLVNGLCSSRISLEDFNNNYCYYVVNLDRKLEENENTRQSLLISGNLVCEKPVHLHCFIERYKQIKVDVETGSVMKETNY